MQKPTPTGPFFSKIFVLSQHKSKNILYVQDKRFDLHLSHIKYSSHYILYTYPGIHFAICTMVKYTTKNVADF